MADETPLVVSIGPIPEWHHIGISSLVPGKRMLLVPSQDSDVVSLIDLNELSVVKTIKLERGSAPWNVKAGPDGETAYVSNSRFRGHVDRSPRDNSTVSVISLDRGEVVKEIEVGGGPVMLETDSGRRRVYVTNRFSNSLSVISAEANEVTHTLETGDAPFWVRLSPDGEILVVANFGDASLSIYEAESLELLNTITVGSPRLEGPFPEFGAGDTLGFSISSDGRAHVANWRSHSIATIDLRAAAEEGRRGLLSVEPFSPQFPFNVEIDEDRNLMIIGSYNVTKSRLLVYRYERNQERLGAMEADLPVDGSRIPVGRAAEVNYWMSEPFESRIIGYLPKGLQRSMINPIDLVAAVL